MTLAITSTILAAKICEPYTPSFKKMLFLAAQSWNVEIKHAKLLAMESRIVLACNFDFKFDNPLTFLERFLRLYGLDRGEYYQFQE